MGPRQRPGWVWARFEHGPLWPHLCKRVATFVGTGCHVTRGLLVRRVHAALRTSGRPPHYVPRPWVPSYTATQQHSPGRCLGGRYVRVGIYPRTWHQALTKATGLGPGAHPQHVWVGGGGAKGGRPPQGRGGGGGGGQRGTMNDQERRFDVGDDLMDRLGGLQQLQGGGQARLLGIPEGPGRQKPYR